jgi:hypothetical protein
MPLRYQAANDELRETMRRVIEKFDVHGWEDVRIEIAFCWDEDSKTGLKRPPKSGEKDVWGRTRVITGHAAWLATAEEDRSVMPEPFFLIEISLPTWNDLEDRPKHREALVAHELGHCVVDYDNNGDRKLSLKKHDIEEFAGIVMNYGLWRFDVERFVKAGVKQMSLFDLMECHTTKDNESDSIEVAIGGRMQRITRGELRDWVKLLEEQAAQPKKPKLELVTENYQPTTEAKAHPDAISANEMALQRALTWGDDATALWTSLAERGASDEEIFETLAKVFADRSVTTDGVSFTTKTGDQPKFWARQKAAGKPTYEGKRLLAETRRLLNIPLKSETTALEVNQ